jgi:hypothetical protein
MMNDVKGWVERWLRDLINDENVSESVNLAYELLSVCNHSRRAYANIISEMLTPKGYRDIWMETSAYVLYNWEASVIHLRLSLILALSALYNSAFTLLRNALELTVKGALYEGLAHKEFREKWILPPDDSVSQLRREVLDMLKANPEEADELEEGSAHIFDLVRGPLYELHLQFRSIVTQVIHWNLLYPLNPAETFDAMSKLYGELCSNVHEHPDRTDMGRIIMEKGELFEQKPLKGSLEEFLDAWLQVLDVIALISINVLKSRREIEEVKAILSRLVETEDFKCARMPLTKRLFKNLGILVP